MSIAIQFQKSLRIAPCKLPLYDFLAPYRASCGSGTPSIATRSISTEVTSTREPSRVVKGGRIADGIPAPFCKPLSRAQHDFLGSALRVNQAGELAATLIYTSQMPLIVKTNPHLRPLIKHMYDQEAGHFKTFNALMARHRIRPTAMYPVWTIAASVLGWGTALLGRQAAMACTEAVETEIGDHYNGQVRALLEMIGQMEANGEGVGEELRELVGTIRRIRDEELEHLDHAVENDAKEAVPYGFLTGIIRTGCRGAIWMLPNTIDAINVRYIREESVVQNAFTGRASGIAQSLKVLS